LLLNFLLNNQTACRFATRTQYNLPTKQKSRMMITVN